MVSYIDTIAELQKKIDDTDYWDEIVLDITSKDWMDEITIVYGTVEEQQSLTFKGCYKQVFHHAPNEKDKRLSNISAGTPSDYWMHDITLEEAEFEGMNLIRCNIDMAFLSAEIWCKDIETATISR